MKEKISKGETEAMTAGNPSSNNLTETVATAAAAATAVATRTAAVTSYCSTTAACRGPAISSSHLTTLRQSITYYVPPPWTIPLPPRHPLLHNHT